MTEVIYNELIEDDGTEPPTKEEIIPIFDWELSVELTGGEKEAHEILDYLLRTLPEDIQGINRAHTEGRFTDLSKQVHRLHGALCYFGFTRLKFSIAYLDLQLRNYKIDEVPGLIEKVNEELKEVLKACENYTPPEF